MKVLGPAHQCRNGEEAEDRNHGQRHQADEFVGAEEGAVGDGVAVAGESDHHQAEHPHRRDSRRDQRRALGRPVLQPVQDLGMLEAVVIGDGAGLCRVFVGGALPFRAAVTRLTRRRAYRALLFGRFVGLTQSGEYRVLERVLDSRESQGCGVALGGGGFLRHTLYNSRIGTNAPEKGA